MFWEHWELGRYDQRLDPLANVWGSAVWSPLLAAVPVILLLFLLVGRRWTAPRAGAMAALSAWVIAVVIYGMHPALASMSFVHGVTFGLLPIGWTVFTAMLLYNITVKTGQFDVIRRSIAGLSDDARVQAVLIGFAFGAFLEGAAGAGTPVAICGAILVGLGFRPFLAAVICLIANTSPVAYGGLGTPIMTLAGVTDLPGDVLSQMAGWQLPIMSLIVPMWMVRCMCSWKQTWEVWPLLLVAGGSFAAFQFVFATTSFLWFMTDIGGGMFSLVVTAIFLRYWKPKTRFHFDVSTEAAAEPAKTVDPNDPHAAEAKALIGDEPAPKSDVPLTFRSVSIAWMPYVLMSVFLLATGLIGQQEKAKRNKVAVAKDDVAAGKVQMGGVSSNYLIAIPTLHKTCYRAHELSETPAWFKNLDVNKDDRVSLAEFTAAQESVTEQRFKELDKDGDQGLSVDEVKAALKEPPETHDPPFHALAPGKLDPNDDKRIALDEFLAGRKAFSEERFRTLDRDGDGLLTPEEARVEGEDAVLNFIWLTAPGTGVLFAALTTLLLLRVNREQLKWILHRTLVQMKVPIPTICFMIGLSYVTRYSGMDATLGYAFAETGAAYPFFAAILGWLGVFLTGTDAGSNALFGSLQKITATRLHQEGVFPLELGRGQAQVLICTANSTGGVMGKMIDAQSIVVATAATNQVGKEADIFKAVVWHSIALACIVGLIVLLQAYVFPWMVPDLPK